jgi:hypothetical protein
MSLFFLCMVVVHRFASVLLFTSFSINKQRSLFQQHFIFIMVEVSRRGDKIIMRYKMGVYNSIHSKEIKQQKRVK